MTKNSGDRLIASPLRLACSAALGSCLISGLLLLIAGSAQALESSRQQELLYLLRQDCGSCHGMTLKGGLGPSLLAKDLKDKPDAYLKLTIAEGRANTAMPPWKNILSDEDINFIVAYLKSEQNEGDLNP